MKRIVSYLYYLIFLLLNTSCSKDDDWYEIVKQNDLPNIMVDDYPYNFTGAEKYMNLNENTSGGQGGACYGDYFIQGYNSNSYMDVYNLKSKSYVCRMQVPEPKSNSRYHVNTMNFGNQFVYEGDRFPVLYVCSGYTITKSSNLAFVYVYHIKVIDDNTMQLELIQTITLKDFCTDKWTEAILDNENDAIWIKSNSCIYRKYKVPSISERDCVLTPYDNVLKEINIGAQPFVSHNQGHLFHGDRILFATGVPSWGETVALIIINTLTGEREHIVNLFDIGLFDKSNSSSNSFEPESVIIYEGQVMICYCKAIYKLLRYEN